MEDEPTKTRTRRAIDRYRRLREWITDLQARRALRELIKSEETRLTGEPRKQAEKDERDK
jgi:hypothetical protein